MRVKRFVAETMQEAIARVKEEYGPDAVILQTRTFRRGLFGLLGPRRAEVLAAVDPSPGRGGAAGRSPRPADVGALGAASGARVPAGQVPPGPTLGALGHTPGSPVAPDDERAVLLGRPPGAGAWPGRPPAGPAQGEDPAAEGSGAPGPGPLTPDPARWAVRAQAAWQANGQKAPGVVTIANGHTQRAVPLSPPPASVAGEGAGASSGQDWPTGLERVYRRLVDRAVEPPFARKVAEGILPLLPPGVPLSDERVLELARDHLASLIPVSPSLRLGAGPRRVVVLVGPTGVGKTTSLAKLAAHHGLMAGHPVGLLTFDTYRVGAAEQLRTYAEIIGLPMEVVYHPGELAASLERMSDRHLILVDTAGRSPHDLMRLQEMRSYLRMLPEPEVYLVLSATVRYADMVRAAERFEPLGYRHLILTKVDETTSPGMVLNAVFYTGRPLAYLSTGQDVPDDFEAADPDRIAAQLLEENDE